jgi:hypothetical protein
VLPWEKERGESLARGAADFVLRGNSLTKGMSVDVLDPEKTRPGGILWPCLGPGDLVFEDDRFIRGDVRGRNILFRRGSQFVDSQRRFPTPDGKINLAKAAPSPIAWGATSAKRGGDDPGRLRMVATVAVDYINGWSGCATTPFSQPVGIIARIHPGTAAAMGINNGDAVVIKNERGEFVGTAEISGYVARGVVWCVETPGRSTHRIGPFGLFEVAADGAPQAAFTEVLLMSPGEDLTKI